VVALPTTMTLFAGMGVVITSATAIIYGKAIWDPVELVGQFKHPLIVLVAMFTIVVATLSVNIAANVVSPANDFANAFPRRITFRRGGLLTGLIGIAMRPWRILESGDRYIGWLITLSGGMGTVAGVLIADYWLVRKKKLQLEDLYLLEGSYLYRYAVNWRAVLATVVGCALAWGGLVIPAMAPLVDYGWFVGAFSAGALYYVLCKTAPEAAVQVAS
jgi:NCS1 family nucleobase:cation symporter-1